eukprot:GHVN01051893.1.p1 GENE.GHVN01051893.1~~GHVN01051893.1.p1  ORF type:complete len:220 (+),score=14.46 GHVN01051893.1:55-714(+)
MALWRRGKLGKRKRNVGVEGSASLMREWLRVPEPNIQEATSNEIVYVENSSASSSKKKARPKSQPSGGTSIHESDSDELNELIRTSQQLLQSSSDKFAHQAIQCAYSTSTSSVQTVCPLPSMTVRLARRRRPPIELHLEVAPCLPEQGLKPMSIQGGEESKKLVLKDRQKRTRQRSLVCRDTRLSHPELRRTQSYGCPLSCASQLRLRPTALHRHSAQF